MDVSEICSKLDEATRHVSNWNLVGDYLRQEYPETVDNPLIPFIFAFNYFFVEESQEEYKSKYGDYAPFIEFSDGRIYPPPLTLLNEEVFQQWDKISRASENQIIISRLEDLLWTKRWGNKSYQHACNAIDSYLKITESYPNWDELDKVFCLTRGLELALCINDSERINIFIQQIHDECLLSIAEKEPNPGITIRLLDSLLLVKLLYQPFDLEKIIKKCKKAFSKYPWIIEELHIKHAKFVGDCEERKKIYRKLVILWVKEAEKSTGFMRIANYEHALELARDYGFSNKIDEIRKKIQDIPEESLGFKELAVTTKIGADKVERFIQAFVDKSDWRTSFSKFGTYGPPSGKYEDNLLDIEKMAKENPVRLLITYTIYGEHNVPLKSGNTIDENKQLVLVQNEVIGTQIFGIFAPDILERICNLNGRPNIQNMTDYFTTSIITPEIAENIAISFDWYFKGEFDISAHLLIPRIEAVFRLLAQNIGVTIIREASGVKTGGVITLADLFAGLRDSIDESWRRYFMTLLINPIGINLRNRVCHGLIGKVDRREAALILHVACYLRHLEVYTKEILPKK